MKTAYGLKVPTELSDVCDPAKMALIIYDMQVGIVSQIDNGEQIAQGCRALLGTARAGGYRIFFTRHISLPSACAGVAQLRRSMIWQHQEDPLKTDPPFIATSETSQITPHLQPFADEVVIDKITMSAFEGTYLNIALRDIGLRAFVIAGIALDVGIEPTVRHALDLNYIPVVISDLCGSRTAELHTRSIDALRDTGEVMIVAIQDLLPLLSAHN